MNNKRQTIIFRLKNMDHRRGISLLNFENTKQCDVFITGIPLNTPLNIGKIKIRLAAVLQEFGELSEIKIIPPKDSGRNFCAIAKFAWNRNAIEVNIKGSPHEID